MREDNLPRDCPEIPDEPDEEKPCIEVRFLDRLIRHMSIPDYERGLDRAKSIGTHRGLCFHGLRWTPQAPPVEDLTTEWQQTQYTIQGNRRSYGFRITN